MTADAARSNPVLTASGGWGVPAWLGLIVRKVQRALLSAEEERLLHLAEFGASTFGAPLLEAESLDDLDDRLDAVVELPALQALTSLMVAPSTKPEFLAKGQTVSEPGSLAVSIFGAGTAELLTEGLRLSGLVAWTCGRLLQNAGEEVVHRLAEEVRTTKPLAFLSDPMVPAEAGLAMLGGMKAGVCLFAICRALLSQAKVEPWLSRAIAERLVEGQRCYLRLLASFPGSDVPEEDVPVAERMDLARLMQEAKQANERFRELAAKAKEAEVDVYPPHAEADDD